MIKTKHLRQDSWEQSDGTRIYVGRLYPRGIKDNTLWHERDHGLGPSRPLHKLAVNRKISWAEYEKRYRQEMMTPESRHRIELLATRSANRETLTLLCDHPKHLPPGECHRFILKELIDEAETWSG